MSSEIRIRKGSESDFERLRVIAVEAKAHWGYERDLVEEWAHGGDFEPESLRAGCSTWPRRTAARSGGPP